MLIRFTVSLSVGSLPFHSGSSRNLSPLNPDGTCAVVLVVLEVIFDVFAVQRGGAALLFNAGFSDASPLLFINIALPGDGWLVA